MKILLKSILTLFLASVFAFAASAQVTTSSMTGKVANELGTPIAGAVVIANHTPSGSQYYSVSGKDGYYIIQGLRPGGPYEVTVSLMGYDNVVLKDISLRLGETATVGATLRESSELLDEVVVYAESGVNASKTGAAMAFSSKEISEMPTISHSIADVTRLNPQVRVTSSGSMSFAGTNNRYNSFQIDGAMNNDIFGLTTNGSNGGQAGTQPVSLETIDQIQVNVAPFDVRLGGFTGGSINAVTKSGTNEFHGSVYGTGSNQNLVGSRYTMMNGEKSGKYVDMSDTRYGVTIGGPVIKDKLFFFANYERVDQINPNAYNIGSSASKVDATEARQILSYVNELAKSQGVDYNGYFPTEDQYTKSNKAGIKLDWNINDKHHASFRWSLVNARQMNQVSTASYLRTKDHSYDFVSNTNSFTAELQSRFDATKGNEFRLAYVRVRDRREPDSPSPMIEIANVGDGTLDIGNERSSMANSLDQDSWTLTDNFSWYKGNRTITVGTHDELYRFCNLFIQDYYGTYYYNNPEDFYAGKIARYRAANTLTSATGYDPSWKPTFFAAQLSAYAQDKWNFVDRFELTYGLRVDMPISFNTPLENKEFNALAQSKGWDLKTNQNISSLPLLSPRFGFRWKIDRRGNFVLRGGAGIFTGRLPFVWLSNSYTNTGMTMNTYNTYSCSNLSLILDPDDQTANTKQLTSGTQTINVFAKNFRFPQNFRGDVGFDFRVLGIDFTAEAVINKTINDVSYRNLSYQANDDYIGQYYPSMYFDYRPTYSKVKGTESYYGIYVLENTGRGFSYNTSLIARKSFSFGLDLMASYSFSRAYSNFNGTSSVAASNWNYNYVRTDSNSPEVGNSAFNRPHYTTASAYYHKSYGKGWTSTAGLVFTGASGIPYSVYYYGDLNGDSSNGNDLIYIPTDTQIDGMYFKATDKYSADEQKANLKAWLASDKYMSKHRDEYYERYADNEKFELHFDLHLGQKYEFAVSGHKHAVELTFDILNISNMFCSKWGRTILSTGYYSPITYCGNGQYQFLHDADYDMHTYDDYYSRWRGQIGLKYSF